MIQRPKESFGVIKNLHITLNKSKEKFNEDNIGYYSVEEIKFIVYQQGAFFVTSSNSITIIDQSDVGVCPCVCKTCSPKHKAK